MITIIQNGNISSIINLLWCKADLNCLFINLVPLAFLTQDKFNSFEIVLLTISAQCNITKVAH